MAERESPEGDRRPWEEDIQLINQPRGIFKYLLRKRQKQPPYRLKYYTIDGQIIYYGIYEYPEVLLRVPKPPPHPSLLYELVSFEAPPKSPKEAKHGPKITLLIWRFLEDKYINLDGTLVKFFGIAEDGSYGYYGLPSGSLTRLCIQRVIPSAIIEGERITDSVTKILFYYQENPILNELLPSGHKKALLKLIRKVK
jgi:hypothetical protein